MAFVLRGVLAVNTEPELVERLVAEPDAYVAAWWMSDAPPSAADVELLEGLGVGFVETGLPGGGE